MIIDILDFNKQQTRLEDMIEVVVNEWTIDDDISECSFTVSDLVVNHIDVIHTYFWWI